MTRLSRASLTIGSWNAESESRHVGRSLRLARLSQGQDSTSVTWTSAGFSATLCRPSSSKNVLLGWPASTRCALSLHLLPNAGRCYSCTNLIVYICLLHVYVSLFVCILLYCANRVSAATLPYEIPVATCCWRASIIALCRWLMPYALPS